jgi:hypothetical protein
MKLTENSLDWSLKHLTHYYDSDFYPRIFEFQAISHAWARIKDFLQGIDLGNYTPKTPVLTLAPKANTTYRIVHQLDPIDSLILTALVYEISQTIEDYRIPEGQRIACSYRIKPDLNGSFFDRDESGWANFTSKTEELAGRFADGVVLVLDITDFYNQIYVHRIRNIIEEAGGKPFEEHGRALEAFLINLNAKTSRGVPVGPATSIILAEAIMADIDKKVLTYTRDFARWVDDIRIFFESKEHALFVLHELTRYLYSSHRLVFSGEKTDVFPVAQFREHHMANEEREEDMARAATAEEMALGQLLEELMEDAPPYVGEILAADVAADYEKIYEKAAEIPEFEVTSKAYAQLLAKKMEEEKLDMAMLRHLLRRSARYRIRSILPIVFQHLDRLMPVFREVAIYWSRVVNEDVAQRYRSHFKAILDSHHMKLPFVNMWMAHVLRNRHFAKVNLPERYEQLERIRDRALIARRNRDVTWVKSHKDGLDVMGPWDRRAVLYAASILSRDELRYLADLMSAKGDEVDSALADYVVATHDVQV